MRPLRADEIEVRVGQVGEKGVTMLLYKNARVDMAILDETYGAMGWQRKHRRDEKGILYCAIGVYNEHSGEWVWKEDCGTESNTEKDKGEASDAFKRAGTNWGIGRELYTAPFVWLPCATDEAGTANGRKYYKLHNPRELYGITVSEIETAEKDGRLTITALKLSQNGHEIYKWRELK